jgi:hypothetical protein
MSSNRITCVETRERLPLFVGDDLDPEVQAAVREHLASCVDCAQLAGVGTRARRALIESLAAGSRTPSTASLWPGIRSVLRAEGLVRQGSEPLSVPSVRRGRRWLVALAPLAAAAALVAVLARQGGLVGPEEGAPAPYVQVPREPEAGPRLAFPVVQPMQGTLRTITPGEVEPLVPYPRAIRLVNERQPSPNDITAAGYNGRLR